MLLVPAVVVHEQLARQTVPALTHHRCRVPRAARVQCFHAAPGLHLGGRGGRRKALARAQLAAARSPHPAAAHAHPFVVPRLPAVVVHEQLARVAVAALVHHLGHIPRAGHVERVDRTALLPQLAWSLLARLGLLGRPLPPRLHLHRHLHLHRLRLRLRLCLRHHRAHHPPRHAKAQLAVLDDAHVARVAVVRHHLALLPLALPHALVVGVAARHLHPQPAHLQPA